MDPTQKLRESIARERRARLRVDVPFCERLACDLPGGKWRVERVRVLSDLTVQGELVDMPRGVRYLWVASGGEVRYVKLPKPPTDIPAYVKAQVREIAGV